MLNPQYRAKGAMIVHDIMGVKDLSGGNGSGAMKGFAVFVSGRR